MEFLLQNPLILVSLVLIVMVGLAYIIVKPRKKKKTESGKSQNKNDESKMPVSDQNDKVGEGLNSAEKSENVSEESVTQKRRKKKLKKLKPEITRVYEKKKLKTKESNEEKGREEQSSLEEEFLKKMQFVKTSKTVSRLKPYSAEEQIQEEHIDKLLMPEEECVFCEDKHKSSYFDRSRRLSNMISNGSFDDLFCSHISEKYMNMDDISRHIRNCDEIEQKLFERAAKTMANSEVKVNITDDGKVKELADKDSMNAWLEERRRQELAKYVLSNNEEVLSTQSDYNYDEIVNGEFDLSARTVLVVDSILNRKGKKVIKRH